MQIEAYIDYGLASENGPIAVFSSVREAVEWGEENAMTHIESGAENVSIGHSLDDGEWFVYFQRTQADL